MLDRVKKIKEYKRAQDQEKQMAVLDEARKVLELKKNLDKLLDERIPEIIATGIACEEAGIKLRDSHTISPCYATNWFHATADGQLGFLTKDGVINRVGTLNGLSMDKNGIYNDKDNYSSDDIKRFIERFNNFENAFYEYVDRMVGM